MGQRQLQANDESSHPRPTRRARRSQLQQDTHVMDGNRSPKRKRESLRLPTTPATSSTSVRKLPTRGSINDLEDVPPAKRLRSSRNQSALNTSPVLTNSAPGDGDVRSPETLRLRATPQRTATRRSADSNANPKPIASTEHEPVTPLRQSARIAARQALAAAAAIAVIDDKSPRQPARQKAGQKQGGRPQARRRPKREAEPPVTRISAGKGQRKQGQHKKGLR